MTSVSLKARFSGHRTRLNSSKYEPAVGGLYEAMSTLGVEYFSINLLVLCDTAEYAGMIETGLIEADEGCYNIFAGGGTGHGMTPSNQNYEEWKHNLKSGRVGKKPALGMKHTPENKKLFSEVSRKYWDTQSLYDMEEVIKYSFKEANKLFGISRTHYYRLKRGSRNGRV